MRIIHSGKQILYGASALNRFRSFSNRPNSSNTTNGGNGDGPSSSSSLSRYDEQYKALDNLDFMTASKILFSEPPQKKKFGFDFHLVQFFFACLPSLAVYLVAQYARREMKRMDAELELKKQAEFEKEMKGKAAEQAAAVASNPQFVEVKERLEKLEETVKEIAVESKKLSSDSIKKKQEQSNEQKEKTEFKPNDTRHGSESGSSSASKSNQTSEGGKKS